MNDLYFGQILRYEGDYLTGLTNDNQIPSIKYVKQHSGITYQSGSNIDINSNYISVNNFPTFSSVTSLSSLNIFNNGVYMKMNQTDLIFSGDTQSTYMHVFDAVTSTYNNHLTLKIGHKDDIKRSNYGNDVRIRGLNGVLEGGSVYIYGVSGNTYGVVSLGSPESLVKLGFDPYYNNTQNRILGVSTLVKDKIRYFTGYTFDNENDLVSKKYVDSVISVSGGTLTSISAGNGMNFSTITTTGSITLGTPSTIGATTSNALTTNSHTHAITTSAVVSGGTELSKSGDIYSFVISQGYINSISTLSPGEGILGSSYNGSSNQTWNIDISSFSDTLISGLQSTDQLVINDGGTTKKMNVSVLETYMQNNLSFITGDTFLSSGSFNSSNGNLTLTKNDTSNVIVNLDGRYLTQHPDIIPGNSINTNNSNGVVIQDLVINLDNDGHVTGTSFATTNLDTRYSLTSHNHSLTLNGDVSGSGNVSGTISVSLNNNVVDASALNVSSNGLIGQFLTSDGDGSFSWSNISSTGITDFNFISPQNGQIITYSNGDWINSNSIIGNLNIVGNLYISGDTYTNFVENVVIKDNIILINSGETGSGVSAIYAGLEIDRGTLTNYRFVLDDTNSSNPLFKIGEIGDLQPVATRQDTPTSNGLSYWDNVNNRLTTSSNLTFSSNVLNVSNIQLNTSGSFNFTDSNVQIYRSSNDLVFKDVNAGTLTLSDLKNINNYGQWYLRDSSNTLATITGSSYLKFTQTTTISTTFTDNTHGISGDPLEITFNVRDNSISALQLNVSGNGTNGQFLISDGDGSFSWNTANLTLTGDISGNGNINSSFTTTLQASSITSKTALTSGLTSTDQLLVSDSGVLKKMDISVLNSYLNNNINLSFLDLTDVPDYSTFTGNTVVINDDGTGIDYEPRIWRVQNNDVFLADENYNLIFYNYIELEADSGIVNFVNKQVTSSSANGSDESYMLQLDDNDILKIYGKSDGSGGIQSDYGASILDNYFYFGDPASDPSSNPCFRMYLDTTSNQLKVEKRQTNGSWSLSAKFN